MITVFGVWVCMHMIHPFLCRSRQLVEIWIDSDYYDWHEPSGELLQLQYAFSPSISDSLY